MFFYTQKRRRPSPYASRFTTNHNYIREYLRPYGAAPLIVVALSQGGDCEAKEQICLAFLAEHIAKIQRDSETAKKMSEIIVP